MDQFFSAVRPMITIGGLDHFIYLVIIIALTAITIIFRDSIKTHEGKVMAVILIIALLQRILSLVYYVSIGEYTLGESLPLHICRLVCILIIVQFFVRKAWLDQLIFFWGVFAYASFIYPADISPLTHILGVTFVILHSLNILFPLIRHYTVGFMPTFKGAALAAFLFVIYLPLMAMFNVWTNGNYFYLVERPFLHGMGDVPYFFINLFGVCIGFLIIGGVFSVMTGKRNSSWEK